MTTLPLSEIKAITKLLRAEDDSTSKLVEEQIQHFNEDLLRQINFEIPQNDKELKEKYLNLVYRNKREKLKKEFLDWQKKDNASSLEKGILLIASFNNPLLDTNQIKKQLNTWAEMLGEKIKSVKLEEDASSIVNEVSHFIFMELNFKGHKENYYDPHNSYIDKVIETKKGNPILLSILYLLITNKIKLPFYGVNMPAHFLVQYDDGLQPTYVDPFNQGEIITLDDCKDRVKKLRLDWNELYLSIPTNKQIIIRVLQNLINIYQENEEFELKEFLDEYIKALKS